MPIRFTDNALTTLAANLAIAATTMTVAAADGALFAVVDRAVDLTDGQYVTLIRTSDGAIEVIRIDDHDGAADAIAIITRDIQGVHGGIGLAFVTGDVVDARIPQELLEGLVQTDPNPGSTPNESVVLVPRATQLLNEDEGVVIGSQAENRGVIGSRSVVIGFQAQATSGDSGGDLGHQIAIGAEVFNSGDESIVIGYDGFGTAPRTIALGNFGTRASGSGAGNHGITIGHTSPIQEQNCIWLGNDGVGLAGDGDGIIAIGHDLDVSAGSGNVDGIIIGRGFPDKRPGGDSFVTTRPITMNASGDTDSTGVSVGNSGVEVIVATNIIDLKNANPFEPLAPNPFHQFDFGPNGVFFVESLELWVTVIFGGAISQAPEMIIGSTQGSSNILAAHLFGTGFTSNTRERVSPTLLPDSGFNSIWIELNQPAIGPTVMQGSYMIRGTLYDQA